MSTTEDLPGGITAEAVPCLTAKCVDCDGAFDDEFTRHFSTLDDLLRDAIASKWVVYPDGLVCETCTGTRACSAAGSHVWSAHQTSAGLDFWCCDRCGRMTKDAAEASR